MAEGLLEPGRELGLSVQDDVFGEPVQMDNVLQDELSSGASRGETRKGNEVGIFGKLVDGGEYGVFSFQSGESCD